MRLLTVGVAVDEVAEAGLGEPPERIGTALGARGGMADVERVALVPLVLPVMAVGGGEREQAVNVAAVGADRDRLPVVGVDEGPPAEAPARLGDLPADAARMPVARADDH